MTRTTRIIIGVLVLPLGIYWLARYTGMKSKAWAVVVAIVGTVVVGSVLAAATSGGSSNTNSASSSVTTTERPTTTASATTTEAATTNTTLSTGIRVWGSKMKTWSSTMSKAFSGLASTTKDPAGLLTRGSKTQVKAALALAVLENCSTSLDAIRVPNDPRVHRVVRTLHHACSKFEASAKNFASGVDKINATLIRRAASEMTTGEHSVVEAAAQVRVIASNP